MYKIKYVHNNYQVYILHGYVAPLCQNIVLYRCGLILYIVYTQIVIVLFFFFKLIADYDAIESTRMDFFFICKFEVQDELWVNFNIQF